MQGNSHAAMLQAGSGEPVRCLEMGTYCNLAWKAVWPFFRTEPVFGSFFPHGHFFWPVAVFGCMQPVFIEQNARMPYCTYWFFQGGIGLETKVLSL